MRYKYFMQDLKDVYTKPEKPIAPWLHVIAFIVLMVVAFFVVEAIAIYHYGE